MILHKPNLNWVDDAEYGMINTLYETLNIATTFNTEISLFVILNLYNWTYNEKH